MSIDLTLPDMSKLTAKESKKTDTVEITKVSVETKVIKSLESDIVDSIKPINKYPAGMPTTIPAIVSQMFCF